MKKLLSLWISLLSVSALLPSCQSPPRDTHAPTDYESVEYLPHASGKDADADSKGQDDSILHAAEAGIILLGDKEFEIDFIGFDTNDFGDGEKQCLLAIFDDKAGQMWVPLADDGPEGSVALFYKGELFTSETMEFEEDADGDSGFFSGTVIGESGQEQVLDGKLSFGVGTSSFELQGDVAILNGDLGSSTYRQVQYLIEQHPEVRIIHFNEVLGSVNDEVNVETGRLIRKAGFTTRVGATSIVASGGVDLFMAGKKRIYTFGGQLGVHSWANPGAGMFADELPRDHPAHQFQIDYFNEMMPNGADFYFFTLQAAPFDDIHFMTSAELEGWGISTE